MAGFCPSREKRCIPVALSKSEGAGSVRTLVRLPGAHLYIQVLGNQTPTVAVVPANLAPDYLSKILSSLAFAGWHTQRRHGSVA